MSVWVCGLDVADIPRAALFKLKLGLRAFSGPTKVTQVASGLRNTNSFALLGLRMVYSWSLVAMRPLWGA